MRQPIFDGHNDLLLRLMMRCENASTQQVIDRCVSGATKGKPDGHIDLPRMLAGGFCGGLFAVFIPPPIGSLSFEKMGDNGYSIPMPPPIDYTDALPVAMTQIALLLQLIERSDGQMRLCTNKLAIQNCIDESVIAVVLHMEGAEAIDKDLQSLEVFHAAGLKSLGPVWSRNTVFADGVPLAFPTSPDIGGGLTEAGRRLIKACNQKRILVDLSHLNEAGFWQVANLSDAPLVATHSNAWTMCNSARNLTDKQLDAIRDSDGVVGMNLATCFIRSDGKMSGDTELRAFVEHIDYTMNRIGDTRVALGSDFDGAVIPNAIGDIGGLDALRAAFEQQGYDNELQQRLCFENWLNVLERTWGS